MEKAVQQALSHPWSHELRRQLAAWLSSPREASAELLGGQLVQKAMGKGDHGAAQGGVFGQLLKLQGPSGAGTRWRLTQEVDIFLGGEGMRPDVAGWRVDRHPEPPERVNVDNLGPQVNQGTFCSKTWRSAPSAQAASPASFAPPCPSQVRHMACRSLAHGVFGAPFPWRRQRAQLNSLPAPTSAQAWALPWNPPASRRGEGPPLAPLRSWPDR